MTTTIRSMSSGRSSRRYLVIVAVAALSAIGLVAGVVNGWRQSTPFAGKPASRNVTSVEAAAPTPNPDELAPAVGPEDFVPRRSEPKPAGSRFVSQEEIGQRFDSAYSDSTLSQLLVDDAARAEGGDARAAMRLFRRTFDCEVELIALDALAGSGDPSSGVATIEGTDRAPTRGVTAGPRDALGVWCSVSAPRRAC